MEIKRVLLACPAFEQAGSWIDQMMSAIDVAVVGHPEDPLDTLLQARSAHADVVVVDLPASREMPGLCTHLLEEFPDMKVIAVSSDGLNAVLYERGVVKTQLIDPLMLEREYVSRWLSDDLLEA